MGVLSSGDAPSSRSALAVLGLPWEQATCRRVLPWLGPFRSPNSTCSLVPRRRISSTVPVKFCRSSSAFNWSPVPDLAKRYKDWASRSLLPVRTGSSSISLPVPGLKTFLLGLTGHSCSPVDSDIAAFSLRAALSSSEKAFVTLTFTVTGWQEKASLQLIGSTSRRENSHCPRMRVQWALSSGGMSCAGVSEALSSGGISCVGDWESMPAAGKWRGRWRMESNKSRPTSVRPVYHSPTREARRAVINRSNTSTSCFWFHSSDMHTRTCLAFNTWTDTWASCLNNAKVCNGASREACLTTATCACCKSTAQTKSQIATNCRQARSILCVALCSASECLAFPRPWSLLIASVLPSVRRECHQC